MSRRNNSVRRVLICALVGAVSAAITLTNVQVASAATSTPGFLSFEDNDYNGAQLTSLAGGTKSLGFWEGATATIDANPAPKTGKGLKFIKAKSGQAWSGMTVFDGARYGDTSNKFLTFDVHSSVSGTVPIQIKLEKSGGGGTPAYVCVGAAQGWNSLSVDLTTAKGYSASTSYGRVVIIPDFKQDCLGATNYSAVGSVVVPNDQAFYFDNISVNGGTIANVCTDSACTAPTNVATPFFMNFEADDLGGAAVTVDGAFRGGVASLGAPPSSDKGQSLKFVKTAVDGTNAFVDSGVNIYVDVDNARITDATRKVITFDYWSPDAGTSSVLVQIQSGNYASNNVVAAKVVLSAAQGWNSLSADFSKDPSWSSSFEYYTLVIFPDYDGSTASVTPAGQAYFIDNISVNGGTISNLDKVGPVASPTPTPTSTSTASPTPTPTASATRFPEVVPSPIASVYPHVNIRLVSANSVALNDFNSVDETGNMYQPNAGDRARLAYFEKGKQISVTYKVDRGTATTPGVAVTGAKVYLIVNKAYSCSNATFSTSTFNITPDYCGDSWASPGGGQSVLTGTTDASGLVTFTMTNTNANGEVRPPAMNVENPNATYNSGNEVKSNFYPTVGGLAGSESIDNLWPHFIQPAGTTANSITWTAPTTGVAKSADLTLSATSKQGSVFYVSNSPEKCTVSGNKLTLVAAGSCSVTANANGTSTYAAATPVTKVINVTLAANSITWTAPTTATFGNAPLTLTATSKQGSVQYSTTTTTVCTVSGKTLTLVGAGSCKVTANSAADAAYAAAPAVLKTITVAKAANPITVTWPTATGATLKVGSTTAINATSPGGAVTVATTTATKCSIVNGSLKGIATGTCTLRFSVATSTNYLAATTVTRTVTITP